MADDSILSWLDDPQTLTALLGGGDSNQQFGTPPATGQPGPTPPAPPPPPPDFMANGAGSFAPNSTMDANALGTTGLADTNPQYQAPPPPPPPAGLGPTSGPTMPVENAPASMPAPPPPPPPPPPMSYAPSPGNALGTTGLPNQPVPPTAPPVSVPPSSPPVASSSPPVAPSPPPQAPPAPRTPAGTTAPSATDLPQFTKPITPEDQKAADDDARAAHQERFAFRDKYKKELENPKTRDKLIAYTHAEVGNQGPQAQIAFMESVVNRAEARGQTIDKTLSGSYFPDITHQRASRGANDEMRGYYDQMVEQVLKGSNVSNYATGNASGRVGFAGGPQTAAHGGERYGIEGPDVAWAQSVGYGGPATTSGGGIAAGGALYAGGSPPVRGPAGPGAPYQVASNAPGVPVPAPPGAPTQAPTAGGTPPPPAAYMAANGAPPGATPGGLRGSLGLGKINWQAGLAGLGKGMSAVGAQRPGAFGAQSFAAGFGGALTGGQEQKNIQSKEARQAQNDLFNQSSAAFKDWVMGKKLDNDTLMAGAHAQYFMNGGRGAGGGGRDTFSGTPYGIARDIETKVGQYDERLRKDDAERGKETGSTGSRSDAEYDAIVKKRQDAVQKYREDLETRYGVPHDTYLSGTDKSHAFDWDKLTPQQRLQIPDGAWIKKKDPQTGQYKYAPRDYHKHPPYPGWAPPGQQPQPQRQQSPQQAQQEDNAANERGLSDADFS